MYKEERKFKNFQVSLDLSDRRKKKISCLRGGQKRELPNLKTHHISGLQEIQKGGGLTNRQIQVGYQLGFLTRVFQVSEIPQ